MRPAQPAGEATAGRREAIARLTVLLVHLIKWRLQPERRCGSWKSTLLTQRDDLEELLEQSPSLRRYLADHVSKAWTRAVLRAAQEMQVERLHLTEDCPYASNEILDPEFHPE